MGGLASKMPLTATLALLGTLVLSAVPPLSGFQAEWIMFDGIFTHGTLGTEANMAVAFLGIIATVLTVGYTFWPVRKIFFVPLFVLMAIVVVIGIYPDLIMKLLFSFSHGLVTTG
jgi:formate hydrogenlyase subunit 3/multisubunit Na+/H+ antiporter MnhD subunit